MVSTEIIFDPIRWSRREIVLRTNVPPIVSESSLILRKLQQLKKDSVNLRFKFDRELCVTGEGLALALSTLVGKSYGRIRFEFAIPESTRRDIEKWTGAEVYAAGEERKTAYDSDGVVLNFSGGFDSLAARYLLPTGHHMVSMDFGGRFSREAKFFKEFDSIQVRTNLVSTSLRNNSWSFIGLGSLITLDATRAKYCTFGSVIESTGLKRGTAHEKGLTFPPFASAGLTNAPATQGLSEFGTVMIIAQYCPGLLGKSLKSLASPGEEKLFRKWALAKAAFEYAGYDFPLSRIECPPVPHYSFGERFVVDLTAMAMVSFGHTDLAMQLVRGLDAKKIRDAQALSFDFMLRADGRMYSNYPNELRQDLEQSLQCAGISWYSQRDRDDADEFREYWYSKR